MYILGISCYYHDSAAVLLKDGELLAAAQEERFTRVKHDFSFPKNAINFCLEFGGIENKDLDYVVFYEKPFLKFERIIKTIFSTYPKSQKLFSETAINWLTDKLWIKAVISEFLEMKSEKILFSSHHYSHAASAFFCSPYKKSAILTVDGVGEWATTTLGVGKSDWDGAGKNEIKLFEEIRFPHSLGLLYSVFTAFLGFKVNNGEYKVMGMSSYGEPKYVDRIYKLIKVNSDGSFKLNMKYFSYHYSTRYSFNNNFVKLFGEPRNPDSDFMVESNNISQDYGKCRDLEKNESKRFTDIAASIQKVTEDVLIKMANYLYKKTGLINLCMAGGVALNCVANYKILKQTPFENIFIQPAAGDNGAALGAALYVWHCLFEKQRKFVLNHCSWGKSYDSRDIREFLDKKGINYKEFHNKEELLDYVVEALINQKVIGWFQGRFEWGPRALGNRSIIADPRNPGMQDIINEKIKFRELFRPFAPSVLEEYAKEFFELDDSQQLAFKFMLITVPVKQRNLMPAVTHVDGTSRIQLVSQKDNSCYYNLIKKFYNRTKIPMVLNTSFNLKGEPIVNSPCDAYNSFKKSGMDLCVLENFVIEKSN